MSKLIDFIIVFKDLQIQPGGIDKQTKYSNSNKHNTFAAFLIFYLKVVLVIVEGTEAIKFFNCKNIQLSLYNPHIKKDGIHYLFILESVQHSVFSERQLKVWLKENQICDRWPDVYFYGV